MNTFIQKLFEKNNPLLSPLWALIMQVISWGILFTPKSENGINYNLRLSIISMGFVIWLLFFTLLILGIFKDFKRIKQSDSIAIGSIGFICKTTLLIYLTIVSSGILLIGFKN